MQIRIPGHFAPTLHKLLQLSSAGCIEFSANELV